MNTNNSFLQAIKILIKESINSAPYNRTKQAIIVSNNGDNTYDIRFDGKLYTNIISYPNTRSLPLKHIVKVIIPNNQASQMYISAEGSPLIYYPVGSYYETSDASFNPNTTWGGTWVLETAGQVHISAGTGYAIGATGGSATKSYTPQGSVQNHTLTENEIPSHTHDTGGVYTWYGQGGSATTLMIWSDSGTAKTRATGGGAGHNHGFSGTQASIDVMQPYITVNRWHRTA